MYIEDADVSFEDCVFASNDGSVGCADETCKERFGSHIPTDPRFHHRFGGLER